MEAFSLLKYWRGGGGGGGSGGGIGDVALDSKPTATIITAVDSTTTMEVEEEIQNDNTTTENDNDDGPFFDLEFSLDEEGEEEDDDGDDNKLAKSGSDEEDEREFNFTLSSESTNDCTDALSPSEGLFFKGKLVPVEGGQAVDCDVSAAKPPPQFSLLKSATKLRVFMLGLKKSKSSNVDSVPAKKLFTVKFKVEEVPIVSLFTRDNSSRSASTKTTTTTTTKQSSESETTTAFEEKRFSKEVMHKYLKKVKPLYVKVSRRYAEKLRLAGQVSVDASSPAKPESPAADVEAPVAAMVAGKSGGGGVLNLNLPAGLRVVCKHLGKSRSASSAVVAAAPATGTTTVAATPAGSRRRDDSLIQQHDGIQSAILHCKRSFNATRDEESLLSRCASDPSNENKCLDLSRKSSDAV